MLPGINTSPRAGLVPARGRAGSGGDAGRERRPLVSLQGAQRSRGENVMVGPSTTYAGAPGGVT